MALLKEDTLYFGQSVRGDGKVPFRRFTFRRLFEVADRKSTAKQTVVSPYNNVVLPENGRMYIIKKMLVLTLISRTILFIFVKVYVINCVGSNKNNNVDL